MTRAPREVTTVHDAVSMTFRSGPDKLRKDLRAAGLVPCDSFEGRFPNEILPGIAALYVERVIGGRAVSLALHAESLTAEEELGAFAKRRLGVVTFDEARAVSATRHTALSLVTSEEPS